MIRPLAASAIALALSGCVAGVAAGVAGAAVSSASSGGGANRAAAPIFHGFGDNPGWAIDIFDESIVFFTAGSAITVPTPPSFTTTDGHRWETEQITVDVAHTSCRPNLVGADYPQTVRVVANGVEYTGCGAEAVAE